MIQLFSVMTEFMQDLRAVGAASKEDFQAASIRDRIGFIATTGFLTAHQVGMEAALFTVGINAYVAGHETVGLAAPLVAGAATGLFSYVVESGLTRGTARGLETFNGATTEITNRFIIDESSEATMDKLTKAKNTYDTALIAVTVGSPAIVMLDYAKNPKAPNEQHKKVGLRAARGLTILNTATGTIVGAGVLASQELGNDKLYNGVEYLSDSPWLAVILGSLVGVRALTAVVKHRKKRMAQTNNPDASIDPAT